MIIIMKRNLYVLFLVLFTSHIYSQAQNTDSAIEAVKTKRDRALHAAMHTDSVKVEKEFQRKMKEAELKAYAVYPVLQAGDYSGVIPVNDLTEASDPSVDYKLLFDVTEANPDSIAKEINSGLQEVSRIINLHVASGVPLKKIYPVVVIHGPAVKAFTNND